MKVEELHKNFIDEEIWILTFGGAFQRAEIYNKAYFKNLSEAKSEKIKADFREAIKQYIRTYISPQYQTKIDTNKHIENIVAFKEWSKKYREILNGSYLKIGVSQKLINLYLKYLWCLNRITIPPHCPFDRIITKLGYTSPPSWTKLDSIDKYIEFVKKAQNKASEENLEIAEWELKIFQRR